MAHFVEQYRANFEKLLYQPGAINDLLTIAETKTKVPRTYIALGVLAVLAIYLVFGYAAQLLCNIIGFVYPAYASIKAIESAKKDDDTKWLTYWVVFAYFSIIEFFSDILLSWFPLYWLGKCIFLIWCYAPVSWNGSNTIYQRVIRPAFYKYQSRVDSSLRKAVDTAGKLADEAVSAAQKVSNLVGDKSD